MTPYSKMSRRERDRLNKQKRQMWERNPVTRKVESKKTYNRKRKERNDED